MGLSWMEIGLFILVVVVAFGGSSQLPELARSVGQAIGEFKQAINSPVSENPTSETESSSLNEDNNTANEKTAD